MLQFLFDDLFEVNSVDPDGKKFDRVSRILAQGENYGSDLLLDINFELFPLKIREKFTLALSSTLNLDGTPDDGTFDQSGRETLADRYDYVMYGRVYKYEESNGTRTAVYISFGGLLMRLEAEAKNLTAFVVGNNSYLLVKRV
jgi:DNA-directed RNA polymerase I, II, and III subunit RPABC3